MPSTATAAFDSFKDRNALTATQREAIKKRRERVRSILAADGWAITNVMFGGSHARGTKVRLPDDAKSDVDVYVVLDDRHRQPYSLFGVHQPKQLLSDVKTSLSKQLTTPAIRADSPSVRIRYDNMDVDVVPAFEVATWADSHLELPYYDRWMHAAPRQQRAKFAAVNAASGYRFIHLLRMIKYWKSLRSSFPLRSYHLEVLAYNIFEGNPPDDYRRALARFFDSAATYVLYSWDDPGGSGPVASYMTTTQRDIAVTLFRAAASRAQAAIDEPSWSGEIARWRSSEMFGSRFPAYSV